jgi:hypothetical protein
VNVRPATRDDLPAVRALWRERLTVLCQADPRFRPRLDDDPGPMLIDRLRDGLLLVAQQDGEIVGCIGGLRCDSVVAIDVIALDAHTYHARLGRSLVDAVRRDGSQVVALVPRYAPVEQAFWRALGAKEWTAWETPPESIWMTL